MADKVSILIELLDRYTATANKIGSASQKLNSKIANLGNQFEKTNQKIQKSAQDLNKIGRRFSETGQGISRFSLSLLAAGAVSLSESAKFEQLGVAFETLIGDAEKAQEVLKGLVEFTATTPFQLEEVANAGRQLLSFGVEAEDLNNTLRQLGDIAAGTGKPLSEFALIFGKIKAKGKVTGEEMLQLAEKGISLQNILADQLGKTPAEIAEAVSAGQVTFDTFQQALNSLTQEGGRFFNLTAKQSKTLGGLFSTLKDSGVLAFKELGDTIVQTTGIKDTISDLIITINDFTKSFAAFAKENPNFTKFLVVAAGVLALLGPALIVIGQMVIGVAALSSAFGFLGVAVTGSMAPILAIASAFSLALFVGSKLASFIQEEFPSAWIAIGDVIGKTIDAIGSTFQGMIDLVSSGIETIANFVGFVSKAVGNVSGFFSDEPAQISKNVTSTQNGRLDIGIDVKAEQGTAVSTSAKTKGKPAGLNTGLNMQTSPA